MTQPARPPKPAARHSAPVSPQEAERSRRSRRRGNATAANCSRDTRRLPQAADGERRELACPTRRCSPPGIKASLDGTARPNRPRTAGLTLPLRRGGDEGWGAFFIGSALPEPAAFPSEMSGEKSEQRSIPVVAVQGVAPHGALLPAPWRARRVVRPVPPKVPGRAALGIPAGGREGRDGGGTSHRPSWPPPGSATWRGRCEGRGPGGPVLPGGSGGEATRTPIPQIAILA